MGNHLFVKNQLMALQKLNDKWFRFLGIPFFALMGHIIFYNRNDSGEERFGFWGIYLLSLAETMIIWEANRLVILHYRKKYPGLDQTSPRILMILSVCTVITILLRTFNIYIYDKTLLWGYQFPLEGYLYSIFVSLLFVIILGGIYEAFYYFRKWKDVAVESESLKRENLQTQLDSLKRQLSPHFLFNGPNPGDFGGAVEWFVDPVAGHPFSRPVVLLTTRWTASAGETFTWAMNTQEHVTQMGDTTAGGFSDVISRELPNSWLYFVGVGDFRNANGISEEGIGVSPRIYIINLPSDIEAGQDKVLEAAIDKLR